MISPDFINFCILGEEFYDSFHFFWPVSYFRQGRFVGNFVVIFRGFWRQSWPAKDRTVEVREHRKLQKEMIPPVLLQAVNPSSKATRGEHTFPKRLQINNSYFYSLRTLGKRGTPRENHPSQSTENLRGVGGLSSHWVSSWWGCQAQRWWKCSPPPRGYPKGCAWSLCSSPGHPRKIPNAGSARPSPAGGCWCKAQKTKWEQQ